MPRPVTEDCVLRNWRENRDGSITGEVAATNTVDYDVGEQLTLYPKTISHLPEYMVVKTTAYVFFLYNEDRQQ